MRKVAEEQDLKPGENIYLEIILQKKPRYGGSNNSIWTRDSNTKQNGIFLQSQKKNWLKSHLFPEDNVYYEE